MNTKDLLCVRFQLLWWIRKEQYINITDSDKHSLILLSINIVEIAFICNL